MLRLLSFAFFGGLLTLTASINALAAEETVIITPTPTPVVKEVIETTPAPTPTPVVKEVIETAPAPIVKEEMIVTTVPAPKEKRVTPSGFANCFTVAAGWYKK